MNPFDLEDRIVVITGGAGLLGVQHAKAVADFGGIPVIADLDESVAHDAAARLGGKASSIRLDVTDTDSIDKACEGLIDRFGKVDVLINNAARNPKVEAGAMKGNTGRLEDLDLSTWNADLNVGLTGAMLCSRAFGAKMAERGAGVILNIASDLAIIGPDQRLYRELDTPEERQPKKPVSYSVVKTGLIGLTRYLATYWGDCGVRSNALCPGGVENRQPPEFLDRIRKLIPMDRMAKLTEYHGAIVFLCSDASLYMNGQILSIDGGRTVW